MCRKYHKNSSEQNISISSNKKCSICISVSKPKNELKWKCRINFQIHWIVSIIFIFLLFGKFQSEFYCAQKGKNYFFNVWIEENSWNCMKIQKDLYFVVFARWLGKQNIFENKRYCMESISNILDQSQYNRITWLHQLLSSIDIELKSCSAKKEGGKILES